MQILITGGCGYVGCMLVRELTSRGHMVTVVDRMLFGHNLPPDSALLKVHEVDIRESATLQSLLPKRIDAIIHLAFLSNDSKYDLNPRLSQAVNYDSLRSLVALATERKVRRLIFASSCSVYGDAAKIVDETSPAAPLSPYATLKLMCEQYLRTIASRTLNIVILRPGTVAGFSHRQRLDLLINRFTVAARMKGRIEVSNPESLRPIVHIHELVNVYVEALTMPLNREVEIFNVSSECRTQLAWAKLVASVVPATVEITRVCDGDSRTYDVDASKIRDAIQPYRSENPLDAILSLDRELVVGDLNRTWQDDRHYNLLVQRRWFQNVQL